MYKGKVRGIYDEWEDYQKQVNGLSSNNHKWFKTKEQAKASYLKHLRGEKRN
jgi:viroplasmin and RNaseH domain-containing protein